MNLERFEAWLRDQGYQESTVRLSLTEARQIERLYKSGDVLRADLRWTGKRMIAAGVATGQMAAQITALAPRKERALGGRKRKVRRKADARSIDDAAWRSLFAIVRADPADEARVIEVLMAHGKRVGDVLRVEREELRRALKTGVLTSTQKGGVAVVDRIDETWTRLWAQWQADEENKRAESIAGWLCPTNPSALPGSGAYKRTHRKLKTLAKQAGINERVFLHRLRRTVAVQALREEKDIGVVQQLLGHASPHTTMHYIDEARPDDVEATRARVRKRFTE